MDKKYYDILKDTDFKLLNNYSSRVTFESVASDDNLDAFLLEESLNENNNTDTTPEENISDTKSEELGESIKSSLAYKECKKEAVDAVITSRERHLAQRDWNNEKDIDNKRKLQFLKNKLSDDKVYHLSKMVDSADSTDGDVSVDIRDEDKDKGIKSITADFKRKTHMSLHVVADKSPNNLRQNRDGRQQSTGYGENNKFIKDITGKDIRDLVDSKYASDRAKLSIKEEVLFEGLTTTIENKDISSLFNTPIGRLTMYTNTEIKKELLDKGQSLDDLDRYKIPQEDRHLTLNILKAYVLANGNIDQKDKVREKIENLKKSSSKAEDKGKSFNVSFGTIKGIYNIYKACKKKSLREKFEINLDNYSVTYDDSDDECYYNFKKVPGIKYTMRINGNDIGYAIFPKENKSYLSKFFINDECRGLGFGQILLKHCIDDFGCSSLDVRDDNSIAKHIYSKFGFKPVDKYRAFEKADDTEPVDYLKMERPSDATLLESEFSDDLKNIYGNLDSHTISLDKAIEDKCPISDVIEQVKDIVYGFINKKNGERIDDREWIHNCKDIRDYYDVQRDPEITLKNKLGICQDQSLAIQYLLKKLHPDYKCQIYALIKGRFGHAVPCYCDTDNKWYYLENAWDKERGLHGAFNSQKELEDYLSMIYHRHHDKDNDDEVTVMPYEAYENLSESVNYNEKRINLIG